MSSGLRPRTTKGALVRVGSDSRGPIVDQNTDIFVFQYNPDVLVRTLSYPHHEASTGEDATGHAQESPVELISLTLELDSADQLEEPEQHPETLENGLHASLAALESMMNSQSSKGRPMESPVALFIWGPRRILPVRLMSLRVSEEAFDQKLNPIRAKIDLTMKVLGRSELKEGSLGHAACTSHLNQKSSLVSTYRKSSLDQAHLAQIMTDVHQYLAEETTSTRERKKR